MTHWLAGETITADALNDQTPVAGSVSEPAAETGFTVSSWITEVTPGGTLHWYLQLTYSGSTLTGSSTGTISNTNACVFSTPVPASYVPFIGRNNLGGGGTSAYAFGRVAPDGTMQIEALAPGGTLKSGDILLLNGCWEAG